MDWKSLLTLYEIPGGELLRAVEVVRDSRWKMSFNDQVEGAFRGKV